LIHSSTVENWQAGNLGWGGKIFPCLVILMTSLLTIPVSSADSVRGFPILRKIHTDQRPCARNFDHWWQL